MGRPYISRRDFCWQAPSGCWGPRVRLIEGELQYILLLMHPYFIFLVSTLCRYVYIQWNMYIYIYTHFLSIIVCVCSFRRFSCWRWGDILVSPLERACNAFLLILGQLFVAKAASPDLDWLAFGKQNSSLWKLSIYRWVMMIYLLKMVI